MTIDTHRALIEGVKNEKLLRLRLNELKYYRKIGLTKLSEINKFNKLQKHRRQKVSEIFVEIYFENKQSCVLNIFIFYFIF